MSSDSSYKGPWQFDEEADEEEEEEEHNVEEDASSANSDDEPDVDSSDIRESSVEDSGS